MSSDTPGSIPDAVARIEREGVGTLASHRLLALLGIALDGPQGSAPEVLRAVLDDPEGRCFALSREGRARVAVFRELHTRCLSQLLRRTDALEHSAAIRAFVHGRLRDMPGEVFAGVFLDRDLRLLALEVFSHGTLDGSTAQVRAVARRALFRDAAALVSVHYRPSGYPEPGEIELENAQVLVHALALVEVRVVDHLLVDRNQCISFAERRFL